MDHTYIEEFQSMDVAKTYVEEIVDGYKSEDVLCLFDIDLTLLEPSNPAVQYVNIVKHKEIWFDLKKRYACFSPAMCGAVALVDKHEILDQDVFKLLHFLNERKIRNLGFTATLNVKIEGKDLREIRYQQLKENNISFEQHFPQQEVILDSVKLLGNFPCIYKGIIFSHGNGACPNKGVVLPEFLKLLDKKPKCIIFFDDNFDNLLDVNQHLAETNPDIDFYGILFSKAHYKEASEVSDEEFEKTWEGYFQRESLFCKKSKRKNCF